MCPISKCFADSAGFLYLLLLIGIVFFSVFVYSVLYKKEREALNKLAAEINGYIPRISLYRSIKGQYQGIDFLIKLIPAGKNTPPYLIVDLYRRSSFKLNIYGESALTYLGKKLGLMREVKVGDEGFDKRLMISSNRPDDAALYLINSDRRSGIEEIFNKGFESFVINGKSVSIRKPYYDLKRELSPEFMKEILRLLNLIASGLAA